VEVYAEVNNVNSICNLTSIIYLYIKHQNIYNDIISAKDVKPYLPNISKDILMLPKMSRKLNGLYDKLIKVPHSITPDVLNALIQKSTNGNYLFLIFYYMMTMKVSTFIHTGMLYVTTYAIALFNAEYKKGNNKFKNMIETYLDKVQQEDVHSHGCAKYIREFGMY
jgi:hypothetical protein